MSTVTPFGELKKNPALAAAINEAVAVGLTEERAEVVMQSAGKLSFEEGKHIDGLIKHAEEKGASKISVLTLKEAKRAAEQKRTRKLAKLEENASLFTTLPGLTLAGMGAGFYVLAAAGAALPFIGVGLGLVALGGVISAIGNSYGKRK